MDALDTLTFLSLLALNIDIAMQNLRVYKRKSSADISLSGLVIRYAAIFIILVKYLAIEELVLILGQGIIAVNVTLYLVLVIKYRPVTKV